MARENTIAKKEGIVSEITASIKDSTSVVFFDYRGLSVSEMTDLRQKLRESGSVLKVYKNTLTSRALDDLKIDIKDQLFGPSAVVFSDDAVEPVKVLDTFSKKNNLLKMKVGIIDGDIIEIDGLKELATIPSREGLLTMLAGGMLGTVRDLSCCLHLYAEQLEEN